MAYIFLKDYGNIKEGTITTASEFNGDYDLIELLLHNQIIDFYKG